ncbi:isoflavone reductase [Phlyctema vagabunda]|uniref:Isoflavone reductase n=1 Tax=Phlyctema vagabunda TaxID=108571 RepID=A0ABR4PLT4_9HELO
MSNNILVLGLGELGSSIVDGLTAQRPPGTKITVLLRPSSISSSSPEKQEQISKLTTQDVAVLPGDIANDDANKLSELFQPYDLIISSLGFSSGRGSQLKIARAVLAAGVQRFVPWQFGVDYDAIGKGSAQDLFDEQLDVRALLRGQDATEWLIVSTGMFTSFLFEPYFGVVDTAGGVVRALGGWDNRITVTTAQDIGKLTASVVFQRDPVLKNQVVYTAGDTVSFGALAQAVGVIKKDQVWKRELWSVQKLEEDLKKDPENEICKYRVVFAKGVGVAWETETTYNSQKGIEVLGLKEWAAENL